MAGMLQRFFPEEKADYTLGVVGLDPNEPTLAE